MLNMKTLRIDIILGFDYFLCFLLQNLCVYVLLFSTKPLALCSIFFFYSSESYNKENKKKILSLKVAF